MSVFICSCSRASLSWLFETVNPVSLLTVSLSFVFGRPLLQAFNFQNNKVIYRCIDTHRTQCQTVTCSPPLASDIYFT